ncbi:SO2930 family diheme c-type cytochrome [Mongoliibacter ruber]|uniref:Putative repeat protein (TIGR03806 family) n=1 Tax=Mongoliibacter ruber TaxID=1750599 RepID=A0A2T0WLT0_9BACT|nr:SO2930 family diheme c-type cytochrome [Mongoliibacter ruber]PRY87659.1 putative repeat protein (TIGR03806 family) [Mongoliibacter ruber]
MKKCFNWYSIFLLYGVFAACSSDPKKESPGEAEITYENWEAPEVELSTLDFDQMPFKNLSDYGFFKGKIREMKAADGVMIYEPASSLFTDYAHKSRYIWMPDGQHAAINDDMEGTMAFPDRTVLIKNFYYPADFNKPEENIRMIETRLMIRRNGIWEAYPYVWNNEQTDASYKVVGAEIPVKWKDEKGESQIINYIVPNKNQCKSCHNVNEEMAPIGVKAKHLNHPFAYSSGNQNQLVKWEEVGYLKEMGSIENLPSVVNYTDQSQGLNLRAMAYLDINCAHCHRAEGPASTSGLFLNYEERDHMKLGVFKTPVAAGFGAGSFKFAIYPGKADESILTFRMGTNQVGAAMPEIGRVSVHEEGLQLIKDWINEMDEKTLKNQKAQLK